MSYTWVPFYKELAQKLLQFRNDRTELVRLVYGLDREYTSYLHDHNNNDFIDLHPFAVFSIFNRGITENHKKEILLYFKEKLQISSSIPEDFNGIPNIDNRNSFWGLYWEKENLTEIEQNWQLFEAALIQNFDEDSFCKYFDIVMQQSGAKWNVTQALFRINPDKFLSLDGSSIPYFEKLGITTFSENELSGKNYLSFIKKIQNSISSNTIDEKSFLDISYNAWIFGNERKTIWLVGTAFGSTDDHAQEFLEKNTWEGHFDNEKDASQLKLINSIKEQDIIALKSTFTKGQKHNIPSIRIKGFGIIQKITIETGDLRTNVFAEVNYSSTESKDFDGSEYGKYRKTIHRLDNMNIENYINENLYENNELYDNIPDFVKKLMHEDLQLQNRNKVLGIRWENKTTHKGYVFFNKPKKESVALHVLPTPTDNSPHMNWYSVDNLKSILKDDSLHIRMNHKEDGSCNHIAINDLSWEEAAKILPAIVSWSKDNQNKIEGDNPMKKEQINYYKNLLLNTHNLILHGAPGTGKTHLAKEIAKGLNENSLKLSIQGFESFISQPGYLEKHPNSSDQMGTIQRYESIAAKLVDHFGSFEEIAQKADLIKSQFKTEKEEAGKLGWDNNQIVISHIKNYVETNNQKLDDNIGFVQFHPSYDYTDFVEGLRPVHKNEEDVSFEKTDGIFKKFCIKALETYKETNGTDNFNECYDKLIEKIEKENFVLVDTISKTTKFRVEQNEYENGLTTRTYPNDEYKKGEWIPGHSRFYTKEQLYNIYRGLPGVPKGGHDNYRKAIVQYMKDYLSLKDYKPGIKREENQKFVFIIDEINRGELSKIFGELFYSIDPDYRVDVPKLDKQNSPVTIKTQYSNMQDGPNEFDVLLNEQEDFGHFFIPENVYIIGTMNDIDRSVESMDFAFRRRFTFKEITAKDTQEAILSELEDSIREEAVKRMDSLNNAIDGIDGLSSAYHIGGAYFLKLKDLENSFENLWEYHLSGLLREYLRGMEDAEDSLEKLHKAYNLENQE